MGVDSLKDDFFYTLKGYQLKEKKVFTPSMEDYLEMIYRLSKNNNKVHIKDLAISLNVKASSVTKMIKRLKDTNLVVFERYGLIELTAEGILYGQYLLYRHEFLVNFFKFINREDYKLEQVEKIEHFVDLVTIKNLEKFIKKAD